jgi:hypothetical protein
MFELDFAGWFQCRLATDPDAFDDPRGESGWTFAMPGEPDLDRVIRFQDPVAPRSHGPVVGVRVQGVRRDGAAVAGHVLNGADVSLLESPVFDGRNGQIATSANEPIVPFTIRVGRGESFLLGRDPIDLSNPDDLARRQPVDFESNSAEVAQVTGIADLAGYRQQRSAALQADLAAETDPTRRSALERRLAELGKGSIRVQSLGFKLSYRFDLRGPNSWNDPGGQVGPAPAPAAVWSVRFWMGGWDADALSGYVLGTLAVS